MYSGGVWVEGASMCSGGVWVERELPCVVAAFG